MQPPLQFIADDLWHTDGSKRDMESGTPLTGAGVCCPSKSVEITVDPCGQEANTINRAELAAVAVALKAMSMER